MSSTRHSDNGVSMATVVKDKATSHSRLSQRRSDRHLGLRRKAKRPSPNFHLLHEIFEAQADARPENIAVVFGNQQVTYASLETRANRLARYLHAQGIHAGSVAAILLPRSMDAYVAILGVLKAGAAYVPVDPEYPAERIEYIVKNSGAEVLVTTDHFARLFPTPCRVIIRVDADADRIGLESPERLRRDSVAVGSRDLCYIIYTSGTTGTPKGVMIEHQSACHLVCAEGEIFQVRPDDRVYQGFSVSFDASIEEIWLAFHAGATLVVATQEIVHAGPDLSRWLTEYKITVLSCIPTMLSMLEDDVPSLRLIIFGGEACPKQLVDRWARTGRRIVNTYGPTETTVIATYDDLKTDKSVTLGQPVPGYRVYLLNDYLRQVHPGATGEICIGGIGVARGYVGPPEQTNARFVRDPFVDHGESNERMYRTGDLGRLDADGNIEFLGRNDAQVKLRGFRIELTEIESVLMNEDDILAAACTVREDIPGVQQLIAYVVRRNGKIDEERIHAHLQNKLPAYMVPALIETVMNLPKLPNGKLDRNSLPAPRARGEKKLPSEVLPSSETERLIADVWKHLFDPHPVTLTDNFFLDLGGHSLLAARMVSELRKNTRFSSLSMVDVYDHPTISSLAAILDVEIAREQASSTSGSPIVTMEEQSSKKQGRHFGSGVLQTGGLYFIFGARALQWITPYLVYFFLVVHGYSFFESAAWAIVGSIAIIPLLMSIAIITKWIVLGRIRAGRYRLWGLYYVRFWFVRNIVAAMPLARLCGTPLLPFVYRLFGATIGKDVHLETDQLFSFDLISIGDGTSVDDTASLLGCTIENGELLVGPVQIGKDCFVGTRSVLREHTTMHDGARLEDLSLLPLGGHIPQGETWVGSPARKATRAASTTPSLPQRTWIHRNAITTLFVMLTLIIPTMPLFAFAPGVALLTYIDALSHPILYLVVTPLVGGSFVLLLTVGVVIFKWLLVGRVRAGIYPVYGGFYIRKWIVDQMMAISLDVVGSLHATVYLAPWYRALGTKLGKFVELSTATSTTPDLLEIDDGGTVADEASLAAARIEQGWLTLAPTRLGKRAFIGNGAVIPPGTVLGDGSLVGVLSTCPASNDKEAIPKVSWLGSPPIFLPRRQASKNFPEQATYCPTCRLRLQRGAFEILRVTLSPAGFILVTATVVTMMIELSHSYGLGVSMLLLPPVYTACCVAVALGVAALKWMVVGRFRPFEHPQWSWFVWRLEFVNALYEFMVTPLALDALQGTPFLPWYFRMLGARIGCRTYFHTTGLIEFDLVDIGDEAVMNEDSVLQAHLFEDRILKADYMRIGKGCEIGAGSVVLYNTVMEDGSQLDALSLLMKGETLPARTAWAGSPAQRRRGRYEHTH